MPETDKYCERSWSHAVHGYVIEGAHAVFSTIIRVADGAIEQKSHSIRLCVNVVHCFYIDWKCILGMAVVRYKGWYLGLQLHSIGDGLSRYHRPISLHLISHASNLCAVCVSGTKVRRAHNISLPSAVIYDSARREPPLRHITCIKVRRRDFTYNRPQSAFSILSKMGLVWYYTPSRSGACVVI